MTDIVDSSADVNADATVDTSTTTDSSSLDENQKTDADQTKADQEIAKDLAEEESKKDSDEADDTDETDKSEEEDKSDEKSDEESAEEKAKAEESAKGAEARKIQLQTEIRELVTKRNEIRSEVEDLNKQAYRTETLDELTDQGLSEEEAKNEQLRQEMQMKEFNVKIADLNSTLNIEALQTMQDYPIYDPDSPEFDAEFTKKVSSLYQRASGNKTDEKTGLVIESNLAPYEFFKEFAEIRAESGEKSRVEGEIQGQKAADKQIAAAEIQSSTPPPRTKIDPFLKGLTSTDD
jgi:hypothetical protein